MRSTLGGGLITTPPPVKGDSVLSQWICYNGTSTAPPGMINATLSDLDSYIMSMGHNVALLGRAPQGGPFRLSKYSAERGSISLPLYKGVQSWRGGKFTNSTVGALKVPTAGDVNAKIASLESESYSHGASYIAHSNPSKPEMEMLTAIAETVHDGLPHLIGHSQWRDRALTARNAGGEYLNAQFGWVPLVSDIQDFARIVSNSSSLIENYERGSGKRQRRGFGSPAVTTATVDSFTTTNTQPSGPFFNTRLDRLTSSSQKTWFEGAFRYYLAPSGVQRYAQLASKLYGLNLTPDVLWNLAPWSWALDWFGNMGDVMSNISHLGPDATVMEWGYMMTEYTTTVVRHQSLQGIPVSSNLGHPDAAGKFFSLQTVETSSYKTRINASPYGFSVSVPALTGKQQAILAALGLSRLG
jgi:hypothetical protein